MDGGAAALEADALDLVQRLERADGALALDGRDVVDEEGAVAVEGGAVVAVASGAKEAGAARAPERDAAGGGGDGRGERVEPGEQVCDVVALPGGRRVGVQADAVSSAQRVTRRGVVGVAPGGGGERGGGEEAEGASEREV